MNKLEGRYRSLLRMLPEHYRRRWEEDMVSTFMQRMHSEDEDENAYLEMFGRPPAAEVIAVAALAVKLRLGTERRVGRSAVTGDGVRLAVLIWLMITAWGFLGVIVFELSAAGRGSPMGAWRALVAVSAVGAFVALSFDRRSVAKVLAVGAFGGLYLTERIAGFDDPFGFPNWMYVTGLLVTVLMLVALLVAFNKDAPAIGSSKGWLTAFGAAAPLFLVEALLRSTGVLLGRFNLFMLVHAAIVVAGGIMIVMSRLPNTRVPTYQVLALALIAGHNFIVEALALSGWFFRPSTPTTPDMFVGGPPAILVVQTALLAMVFAAAAFQAVRQLREHPVERLQADPV